MKENIATIPLMDALNANDECPFCYLERKAEQHAISFILGSAYMEDDIREKTDEAGFCRHHFKMMYDYGNRLGNALILSTHLKKLNQELSEKTKDFTPGKSGLLKRIKHTDISASAAPKTALGTWLLKKETSCYVCDHFNQIYGRYLDTFIDLYQNDEEFRCLFHKSKGVCLPHFKDLIETAEDKLSDAWKKNFYPQVFALMQEKKIWNGFKKRFPGLLKRMITGIKTKIGELLPTAYSAVFRNVPADTLQMKFLKQSCKQS